MADPEIDRRPAEGDVGLVYGWNRLSFMRAFDQCVWPQFVSSDDHDIPVQMVLEKRRVPSELRIRTNPVTYSPYKWRIVWVDPTARNSPQPHFAPSHLAIIFTYLQDNEWYSVVDREQYLHPWRLCDIFLQLQDTWEPYVGLWKYQGELNLMLPRQEHEEERCSIQDEWDSELADALRDQILGEQLVHQESDPQREEQSSIVRVVRPRLE